jgi:hypothetical protein
VQTEKEDLVEVHATKISEAIQGFHTQIVDLEAHVTPNTPPEERETRKKTMTTSMENIKDL